MEYLPLILQGTKMTLFLWIGAFMISLSLGITIGFFRSLRFRVVFLSDLLDCLTFLFRAVPLYVQLLVAYFIIPDLWGGNFSATSCGLWALGLCSSAYISQTIRAGLDSIPKGQWEACYVLGLGPLTSLSHIIFPQLLKATLPSLMNEGEQLLKSTSLISSIGVIELTRSGMNIVSRGKDPIEIYLLVALIYVVISLLCMGVSRLLEQRPSYD